MARRARWLAALLIPAASACSVAPMDYLHADGPAAAPVASLGWGLIVICSGVVVIITALLGVALWRGRRLAPDVAAAPPGSSGNGLPWIYIGTSLSALVLLGIAVWTLLVLRAVAHPAATLPLTIEIRAHQWWWEARYVAAVPARTFTTANELHIPVGVPVNLSLIGDDVIHSFWIPALAGKTDVIPGQTNQAWLQADQPGIYRGQCTEYCGIQHAHMSAFVEAESPQAFQQWWDEQLAAAPAPVSTALAQGAAVFLSHCAACHTVRGTFAGGISGPDLTHVMGRHTIAAGTLPNTPEELRRWIHDAQAVKPGSRMPAIDLTAPELAAVTAYVQSLR